jgi:phenylacetate-CoA ligase
MYHEKVYNQVFLNKSQWWTREQLENLQLEGLKELVDFARKECPYYRDLPEIKDLADIKQIPVLTKSLIKQNFNKILVSKIPHCITTTGGTVSKVTVAGDLRIREALEAERFKSWYPIKKWDRLCYLWGSIDVGQVPHIKDKYLWLPVEMLINQDVASDYIERIAKFKPDYLKAYAHPLYILARYTLELGKSLRGCVGVIATHCETLTPEMRKIIEEAFGCEVFNYYGSRDLGSQAQDCNVHKDLHVTMERYLLEIEDGRFLFTDLLNYASPLIRYENQDIGEWGESCQCGRGLVTIKPLVGRVLNYLQDKNGDWISGFIIYLPIMYYDHKFGTNLFDWVEAYQIRQREQGKITILLKPWNHVKPPEDLSQQLKVIQEYGQNFMVDIQIVDSIPKSSTGKQVAVDTTLKRWE